MNDNSNLNNIFQQVGRAVVNLQKKMEEALAPFQNTLNAFATAVSGHLKTIDNIGKIVIKAAQHFKLTEKEVVLILKKYKWFITPSMPIYLIYEIIKIDRQGIQTYKKVNKLFISYFFGNNFKELKDMLLRWKNSVFFKKRMKIIKDCIYFVISNQNRNINVVNVVLPSLIAQIDGIINDYLVYKTGHSINSYKDIKINFKLNRPKILTSELDNLINEIILEIFLQTSYKSIPLKTPYYFNRHKIMHGENIRYGRLDYLIKSFLILDFLSELT